MTPTRLLEAKNSAAIRLEGSLMLLEVSERSTNFETSGHLWRPTPGTDEREERR
jgi:hypothetical protein